MNVQNERRKELVSEYKERKIVGGVYQILNKANGKYLLLAGTDLKGLKNRFDFSVKTGSCVSLVLQKEWAIFGATAFEFVVLEELEKNDDQSMKSFQDDLKALKEIWIEKLDASLTY